MIGLAELPNTVRTIYADARALLAQDLAGTHEDCQRFFRVLFTAPGYKRVHQLAHDLAVHEVTLYQRLRRAGLPTPLEYIQMSGYVRAARLLEDPGISLMCAAYELDLYGQPSLTRQVKRDFGMSGLEFRTQYTGARMLERFRAEMILPYRAQLRRFRPLTFNRDVQEVATMGTMG